MNAFIGRIGGKKLLKKQIVDSYFPKDYENMIYVEPFVGGGSIYFYKNPSVYEVINDLDTKIIQLFRGFKKFDGNQISSDINGPYNKEIFNSILNSKPKSEYQKFIKELILIKTSFYGQGKHYGIGDKDNPRSKISSNYQDKYNERLKHTIILNKDYLQVVKKYDSPNTFFYLDPPYENSNNLYKHDYVDLNELFNLLNNIQGLFLLSYNNSDQARILFKNYNIKVKKTKYTKGNEGGQHHVKTELLISNY